MIPSLSKGSSMSLASRSDLWGGIRVPLHVDMVDPAPNPEEALLLKEERLAFEAFAERFGQSVASA